jgi:phosphoglycerate dehydrogenase-like enzyme
MIQRIPPGHAGARASGSEVSTASCRGAFEVEPLSASSPLWGLDNVLISPHWASTARTENQLLTDLFIDNLRRWMAGAPLRNVYDAAAGY